MATAQVETPQFDLSTAVPETDDGKAISALPAFDLNSAIPEDSIGNTQPQNNLPEDQAAPLRQQAYDSMKSGIEQIPPSPASEAVRSWIENVGKGGLEQFKEADYAYTHPNETPEQAETELNKSEVAKGVGGQLNDTFTMAIAMYAPEMKAMDYAKFGLFMAGDATRKAIQNIVMPNATPSQKDVLDIASFIPEAKLSSEAVDAMGNMISKAFTIKGLSPTIDLQPDLLKLFAEPQVTERPAPFVKASQEGWPAQDIETPTGVMSGGILDKLGISQDHFDVSQSTGLPVRIPISKILEVSQDDRFDEFSKALMESEGGGQEQGTEASPTPDEMRLREKEQGNIDNESGAFPQEQLPIEGATNANQGGEGAQSGSGQEGVEGQAQAGVHLRDDAQGGMEAKAGEEVKLDKAQGTGEEKTAGLSKSIEEGAQGKGLVDEIPNKPTYNVREGKEIDKKVSDFIEKNPDLAKKIALREAPEQDGLRAEEVFTGLMKKAFEEGDVPLIHELGTSEKAASAATELGQRVQALDVNDEHNPVKIIQDINKSKPKPTKDMVSDQGKSVKIIKRELNKAKPKADDWNDFIESIKC